MQLEASQEVEHLANNGAAGQKVVQLFCHVSHRADLKRVQRCWVVVCVYRGGSLTV